MKKVFSILFLILVAEISLHAQLSGNYTIGGTTPDYATVTDAVNDLTANGVNGPVVFNIRSGTYSGQFTISSISGVNSTNTLTFQSETGDSSTVVLEYTTGGTGTFLFTVSQTSHLYFNSLTFKTSLTGDQHRIGYLSNGVEVGFSHCSFIGSGDANNYEEDLLNVAYYDAAIFNNCRFENGYSALNLSGNASGNLIQPTVTNCEFYNFEATGIFVQNAQNTIVDENYFQTNNNRNPKAISMDALSGTLSVQKNKMEMYYYYSVSGGQYGMQIANANVSDGLVANNMIYVDGYNGGANGIGIGGTNIDVVYNTVRLRKNAGYNCYAFTGGSGCRVLNNIFVAEQSPVVFNGTYADTVDYNNIYTDGTVDWTQSLSGLGPNNLSVDPGFLSSSDLHVYPTLASDSGTPIVGVTTDIDGDSRDITHPDMGADEIPPLALDASMTSILAPIKDSVYCNGLNMITATLTNLGTDVLMNTTIQLVINGSVYSTVNWSGNLSFQQSEVVNIGTYPFVAAVNYDIAVVTTSPNGGTDENLMNDTAVFYGFHLPLNGVYTLGGTSPDFASFRDLESALLYGGMCGPVTVNVRSGSYHDYLYLWQLPGSSPTNHLTIQSEVGDSTAVELWQNYPSDVAFTVRLEDVGNVTLKDLRIRNNGAVPNNVVELLRAHDVNILNSQIYGYSCSGCSSQTDKLLYGIEVDSNLVVRDVYFISGNQSILVFGDDQLGAASRNFVFENNIAGRFNIYNANEIIIKNNVIGGGFNKLDHCNKFKIEKNTWRTALAFFTCNGVDSTSYFRNNLIYAHETGGPSVMWDWALYLYSGSNFNIYHNTFKCEEWAGCVHYAGNNVNMFNNIFYQTNANVSPIHIYTTSAGLTSDHNVFWTDNVNNPLTNLQGMYGLEAHSHFIDPMFRTNVDSLYWPTNPAIDNLSDSTWRLPDDRFGQLRGVFSEPGAIEQDFMPQIDLGPDRDICAGEVFGVDNGGYTYLWNTGDTTSHLVADTSGTFIVEVTNSMGTDRDTVVLTVYQSPSISLPDSVWICSGDSAILEINQSGLTFSWSNGSTDSITKFDGNQLASVVVTNAAGCTSSAQSYITHYNDLIINMNSTDISCFGANDGVAEVNIVSGDSTFTISWNQQVSGDTLLTGLSAGWYTATVEDVHDCSVSDSVEVVEGINLQANINGPANICQFDTSFIYCDSLPGVSDTWYVDGNIIANGGSINYVFTTAGQVNFMLVEVSGVCADTAYLVTNVEYDTICNPPGYCTPDYITGTSDGDFIDGVELDTIVNLNTGSIGGAPYQNYSYLSTTLYIDSTYNMTITSGDYSPDVYAVWIDYNQDFDFDDAGEKILATNFTSSQSYQTHSFNFTVPAGAMTGTTRLRVVCTYDETYLTPCATGADYGETEDYTVNIQVNTGDTTGVEQHSVLFFDLYPNPTSGSFSLSVSEKGMVKVLSLRGQVVYTKQVMEGNNRIDLSVPNGVYIIEFTSNRGVANKRLVINSF